jgi:hypothetical protein
MAGSYTIRNKKTGEKKQVDGGSIIPKGWVLTDQEAYLPERTPYCRQTQGIDHLIKPSEAELRKQHPVATGVMDYFPDALYEIAHVSWKGNEQHNPGTPVHWDRSKSKDESDALMRHFLARGTVDTDGIRHSAKMAWRALALLQKELEDD